MGYTSPYNIVTLDIQVIVPIFVPISVGYNKVIIRNMGGIF